MEYLTLLASVVLRTNLLVSSRFGEALRSVQEQLDAKNFYAFNPSFDCPCEASCQKCGQQNQNR